MSQDTSIIKRFAHRSHPDRRVISWNPEERQVGWQLERNGETQFVSWGSTQNRSTLNVLIADVFKRYGEMEVVDLDSETAIV